MALSDVHVNLLKEAAALAAGDDDAARRAVVLVRRTVECSQRRDGAHAASAAEMLWDTFKSREAQTQSLWDAIVMEIWLDLLSLAADSIRSADLLCCLIRRTEEVCRPRETMTLALQAIDAFGREAGGPGLQQVLHFIVNLVPAVLERLPRRHAAFVVELAGPLENLIKTEGEEVTERLLQLSAAHQQTAPPGGEFTDAFLEGFLEGALEGFEEPWVKAVQLYPATIRDLSSTVKAKDQQADAVRKADSALTVLTLSLLANFTLHLPVADLTCSWAAPYQAAVLHMMQLLRPLDRGSWEHMLRYCAPDKGTTPTNRQTGGGADDGGDGGDDDDDEDDGSEDDNVLHAQTPSVRSGAALAACYSLLLPDGVEVLTLPAGGTDILQAACTFAQVLVDAGSEQGSNALLSKTLRFLAAAGRTAALTTSCTPSKALLSHQLDTTGQAGVLPLPTGQTPSHLGQTSPQHDQKPSQRGQMPSQPSETLPQSGQTSSHAGQTPSHLGQTSPQHDQKPSQPGQMPSHPSETSPQLGQTSSHAGQTPSHLGQTSPHPGQTPSHPGQTPLHPGQTPSHPGQTPLHPGQTPSYPGQTPSHPGQTPSHSGQTPPHPGQTLSNPGQTPSHPGQTPPHSGQTPSHPGQTPPHSGQTPPHPGQTSTSPTMPTPTLQNQQHDSQVASGLDHKGPVPSSIGATLWMLGQLVAATPNEMMRQQGQQAMEELLNGMGPALRWQCMQSTMESGCPPAVASLLLQRLRKEMVAALTAGSGRPFLQSSVLQLILGWLGPNTPCGWHTPSHLIQHSEPITAALNIVRFLLLKSLHALKLHPPDQKLFDNTVYTECVTENGSPRSGPIPTPASTPIPASTLIPASTPIPTSTPTPASTPIPASSLILASTSIPASTPIPASTTGQGMPSQAGLVTLGGSTVAEADVIYGTTAGDATDGVANDVLIITHQQVARLQSEYITPLRAAVRAWCQEQALEGNGAIDCCTSGERESGPPGQLPGREGNMEAEDEGSGLGLEPSGRDGGPVMNVLGAGGGQMVPLGVVEVLAMDRIVDVLDRVEELLEQVHALLQ